MNKPAHAKKGFTLIELLTVIAILAILGAIIFPTVGQFRTLAKKSSDSSDLRNIVQASQLFAAQNGERLVGSTQTLGEDGVVESGGSTIVDVAAVLAYGGELTDPKTWVSANIASNFKENGGLYTVATTSGTTTYTKSSLYNPADFSFSYVTGLKTSDQATTPVAFTKMPDTTGSVWGTGSAYGDDGGHVAFLGGSVNWYENLTGKLISPVGAAVNSISTAVPLNSDVVIRQPIAPTTTETGTGG